MLQALPQHRQRLSVSASRFGLFNVLDKLIPEGLGIEVHVSLPAARVTRALEEIIQWRGRPRVIRCDNSPEYISDPLLA